MSRASHGSEVAWNADLVPILGKKSILSWRFHLNYSSSIASETVFLLEDSHIQLPKLNSSRCLPGRQHLTLLTFVYLSVYLTHIWKYRARFSKTYVYVCKPSRVSVYHVHTHRNQKKALDPLNLRLQAVMNLHLGSGKPIWILCKSC